MSAVLHPHVYAVLTSSSFSVDSVQNGSLHQKETVHENDFEPYLTSQSTQVSLCELVKHRYGISGKTTTNMCGMTNGVNANMTKMTD